METQKQQSEEKRLKNEPKSPKVLRETQSVCYNLWNLPLNDGENFLGVEYGTLLVMVEKLVETSRRIL